MRYQFGGMTPGAASEGIGLNEIMRGVQMGSKGFYDMTGTPLEALGLPDDYNLPKRLGQYAVSWQPRKTAMTDSFVVPISHQSPKPFQQYNISSE